MKCVNLCYINNNVGSVKIKLLNFGSIINNRGYKIR